MGVEVSAQRRNWHRETQSSLGGVQPASHPGQWGSKERRVPANVRKLPRGPCALRSSRQPSETHRGAGFPLGFMEQICNLPKHVAVACFIWREGIPATLPHQEIAFSGQETSCRCSGQWTLGSVRSLELCRDTRRQTRLGIAWSSHSSHGHRRWAV